jgi:single-strand DNA-binding protein
LLNLAPAIQQPTKEENNVNSISITGNATKDVVVRDVNGDQVASFSIADNGYEKGEKTTTYFDVSVWGKRAATAAQYIKKGAQITVIGRLSTHEKDGKTYLKVAATDFSLPARAARDEEDDF